MSLIVSSDFVRFINIVNEPKQQYKLQVQNASSRPMRVRVTQPTNNQFKVSFDNQCILAPGMSQIALISLSCSEKRRDDLFDQFIVSADSDRHIIRLEAVENFSQLVCHTSELDFGAIPLTTSKELQFDIQNIGISPAQYIVDVKQLSGYDQQKPEHPESSRDIVEPQITVSPLRGDIGPNEKIDILVRVNPQVEGAYHYMLTVAQPGSKVNSISVQVTVLAINSILVVQTEDLNFDAVFMGSVSKKMTLSNPCPFPVHYQLNCSITEMNSANILPEQQQNKIQQIQDQFIVFDTDQGILQPLEEIQVSVIFKPKLELKLIDQCNRFMSSTSLQQWQRIIQTIDKKADPTDYSIFNQFTNEQLQKFGVEFRYFRPELDDLKAKGQIQVIIGDSVILKDFFAHCRRPLFVFGSSELHFDRNGENVRQLEVKNMSCYQAKLIVQCPVSYHLERENGLRTDTLNFEAKQSRIITIVYQPKSLNEIHDFLHFTVENEYFNANIPLRINKLSTKQMLENVTAKINSNITTKFIVPVEKSQTVTLQKHMDETYKLNAGCDRQYNEMKLKHTNYQEKFVDKLDEPDSEDNNKQDLNLGMMPTKVTAFNDGLDLGIDNMYDEGVQFNLEKKDPKYKNKTLDVIDQNQQLINTVTAPQKRPTLNNDVTPTSKVYPASLFESHQLLKIMEECKAKIPQRQLNIISTGEINFDFGSVSFNTKSLKYFKIANDLQQYIKIELIPRVHDDIDNGIIYEITPSPQYLPPGCFTSFALNCTFTELDNKLEDQIDVLVNDALYTSITIKSIVTRPQLSFNYKSFTENQSEEIIQKVTKVLTNQRYDDEQRNMIAQDCIFFDLNSTNAFEKVLQKQIQISNIGTSDCSCNLQFRNQCGDLALSQNLIEIRPGYHAQFNVIWTPQLDELSINMLEVSFQKGTSYFIPIVCRLIAGKAVIPEKQLDLGLVNVSQATSLGFTIQNKSNQKPLYYEVKLTEFVESCQSIELEFDHERGEVRPDEAFIVGFQAVARKIGTFMVKLKIKIIGGEELMIPIKGVIEAPYIEVIQSSKQESQNSSHRASRQNDGQAQRSQKDSSREIQSQPRENIKFENQFNKLNNKITANIPYMMKYDIHNNGRVNADIFVDARASTDVEILDSGDEAQSSIIFQYLTADEMKEKIQLFQQEQIEQAPQLIKTQKLSNQEIDKQLDELSRKYGIPVYKDPTKYIESTNNLMNGQNINELYGNIILKDNKATTQMENKHESNKIVFLRIPPGQCASITLCITASDVMKDRIQNIFLYLIGIHSSKDIRTLEFKESLMPDIISNMLQLQYTSIQSVLQLSTNKLNYGVKVADNNYKQISLKQPIQNIDLFDSIKQQDSSPLFMDFAANSGLFYQDLTVVNLINQKVRYAVNVVDYNDVIQNDKVYMVSSSFGILLPYDTVQIRVYCSPVKVGIQSAILKLYYQQVPDNNSSLDYFINSNYMKEQAVSIQLYTVAVFKALAFSQSPAVFPNTPCGVPSRMLLYINNVGYKNNTKLQIFFPPELSKIIFMAIWPWGNTINHMIKQLPLIITFYSDIPMSFQTKLCILDNNNVPYDLQIAGNCFIAPSCLQEFTRYNSSRLRYVDDSKLGLLPQVPLEAGSFHTINQLITVQDNQQILRQYGITKSNVLSLQSINAKPVISFSDYAVLQKLDGAFYDNMQNCKWDYLAEIPPADDQKKKQVVLASKQPVQVNILKLLLNGPFSTMTYNQYPSYIHRLRFIWQLQFKSILSSEAPLSPFIPYLPDVVKFDIADNIRLNFMLALSNIFLGQKSMTGNFPLQMSIVQNKTSPFLLWVSQLFKSTFPYTTKQLQAIPISDKARAEFLVQAYDSFLNVLKIHGAMLNNIHPALLLTKNDFVAFCKNYVAQQAYNAYTTPEDFNQQQASLKSASHNRQKNTEVALTNEVNLHSPLISQTSSLLLLDLFKVTHDTYHSSAWFHVQTELMRLFVVNQISNPQMLTDSVSSFMRWQQGEASEFKLERGIGGQQDKQKLLVFQEQWNKFSRNTVANSPTRDLQLSQSLKSQKKINPDQIILDFVQYYSNYQFFCHPLFEKFGFQQIFSFDQLFSGFEVGAFILSFVPQLKSLKCKLEDFLQIVTKIIDIKTSADQTDFTLNNIYNLRQKPNIVGEKLFVSLDSARQSIWKEIFNFVKENINISLPDQSLYYFAGGAPFPDQMLNSLSFNHKLLLAILVQYLPGFVPTKSLKIDLNVASTVTQQLEIAGQKHAVKYNCSVFYPFVVNSCDIQLNTQQVFIEAKSIQHIDLSVTAKYLKQCLGFIQFSPIQDTFQCDQFQIPSTMAVLVNVIDAGSRNITTIEGKCGQLQRITIPVENKAQIDAKFTISLVEKFYPIDPTKPIKNDVKPGKSVIAYKTSERSLVVYKNSNGSLNINYLPSHPGLYICQVSLSDDNVGLKNFEIRGYSVLPDASSKFNLVAQITDSKTFYISNQDLELVEKLQNVDSIRYALLNIGHQNTMSAQYHSKEQRFSVTFSPRVKTTADTFHYKLVILLESLTKTFDILLTVLKKAEEQKIQLECPALKHIEQIIEIQNSQPDDTEFSLQLITQQPQYFLLNSQHQTDIKTRVSGNSKQIVNLSFNPKWICETTAKVIIKQTLHNITISEYNLICNATVPDKVQTLTISGSVDEPSLVKVDIPPTSTEESFFVQFDSGNSLFSVVDEVPLLVQPRYPRSFQLKAQSFASGSFQTKMYLQRVDQTYIWYEIKYNVTPRECSGKVIGTSKAFEEQILKVSLQNPLNDRSTQFQVSISGIPRHLVNYQQLFQVPAASTGQYEFSFIPFCMGQWQGKVRFYSEMLGEFWYEIQLTCNDVPIQSLSFESVIGEGVSQTTQIVNPIPNIQITYSVDISNIEAFMCEPKRQFALDSNESGDIKIIYRPTKVDEKEQGMLNVVGKDMQGSVLIQHRFSLEGVGSLQYERPVIKIYAQLNQGSSGQITFKNPFLTRASVKFEYDSLPELSFTTKEQLLEPNQEVVIKYVFIPKRLSVIECPLHILVNPNYDLDGSESFSFDYIFEGIGEYTHRQPLAYLQCQARQSIQKVVKLPPEIQIEDYDGVTFDLECDVPTISPFEDTVAAVRKAVAVEWTGAAATQSQTPQQLLNIGRRALLISFAPLKPFACDIMLVLCASEGGRYKLPLQLFANQPKSEGQILVELPNGSTPGEFVLNHCNSLNVYSEYRAYFTASSSERFSVSPGSGILEPSQQTGIATMQSGKTSQFTIHCNIGNNNARGQLVVETKDIMFIWDVVSGYRKYIPPVGVTKVLQVTSRK